MIDRSDSITINRPVDEVAVRRIGWIVSLIEDIEQPGQPFRVTVADPSAVVPDRPLVGGGLL